MDSNVLLSFLNSLTVGNQGAEPSADASMASENAPQEGFYPSTLGKYQQPYEQLIQSGMSPEEAYATISQQIEADQSQSAQYAPQQSGNPFQDKIAQDPQAQQNAQRYGVYGNAY